MYAIGKAFGTLPPIVSMFQMSESAWKSFFSAVSENVPVPCEFEGQVNDKYCIGSARYDAGDKTFQVSWY